MESAADRAASAAMAITAASIETTSRMQNSPTDTITRRQHVLEHLERIDKADEQCHFPTLPPDAQWLNVSCALDWRRHFAGKLVVVDFFTYCCINCQHVLQELRSFERRYNAEQHGVVVIGSHSPKFDGEKHLDAVRQAVLRHDIQHPVLNDVELHVWNALAVNCWPTLTIFSPSGRHIYTIVGESVSGTLEAVLSASLEFFAESLVPGALPMRPESAIGRPSLRFPGKLALSSEPADVSLCIADSGNHRVLVCQLESGRIMERIGGAAAGLVDGVFEEARFRSPYGVAWSSDDRRIFVCDMENNAIRQVDLIKRKVSTLFNADTEINKEKWPHSINCSPWALAVIDAPNEQKDACLLVAMAGCHQLWVLALSAFVWWDGSEWERGQCMPYFGSGAEENRNNHYRMKSAFAQPSGLAYDRSSRIVYVADAESSTVRAVHLQSGAVRAVVGGERDPSNLFAFGDADGRAVAARLQHPLGIAFDARRRCLYLADTYNNKLKVIDPSTSQCATVHVMPAPTSHDPHDGDAHMSPSRSLDGLLSEPGGVAMQRDSNRLYVADSNHHRIVVVDIETGFARALPIEQAGTLAAARPTRRRQRTIEQCDRIVELPALSASSARICFRPRFEMAEGESITGGRCVVLSPTFSERALDAKASCLESTPIVVDIHNDTRRVELVFELYICGGTTCSARSVGVLLPVKWEEVGETGDTSNMDGELANADGSAVHNVVVTIR